MVFQGTAITVGAIADGLYKLRFDLQGESVNKLNRHALQELGLAVDAVVARGDCRGLLLDSGKKVFIVGADITEFLGVFEGESSIIVEANTVVNALFSRIEDLPFPTVVAINGEALGGGLEVSLCCDFRVASTKAKVGLPETKLGIMPGWGGTVRLPRLIGVDNAIEWIAGGTQNKAAAALKVGVVDAVVAPEKLEEAALDLLRQLADGSIDYQERRIQKKAPLKLSKLESMMAFESARGVVGPKAGKNYPAPMMAIATVEAGARLSRDDALAIEIANFAVLAKSDTAKSLVGIFLKDQLLKRSAKVASKGAEPITRAAVLGAGIMGGGIAYQSASTGTPILMKDITEDAIQLGLNEAGKLLAGQLKRGKLDQKTVMQMSNAIVPTTSYGDFGTVDIVVEAVTENPKIKAAVLAETENAVSDDTIIASNTSTIAITRLAEGLKRPENFCGMHFFNPVHRMPLVEVIRGDKTSDTAVARTVAYAQAMRKTPIVVNDCPGFLVNRILFPYFAGFESLLADGVDYRRIDKVMEAFGWPMGPAYLLDVVGMDTASHAGAVMAEGFPDRMQQQASSAVGNMVAAGRLGQKTGSGFYSYKLDKRGKPKKSVDTSTADVLAGLANTRVEVSDEEIIARMMVPLCTESARCLEDNIVATPAEVDMGLVYGIGFPPFRGGALQYMDDMGLKAFVALTDKLSAYGPLFSATEKQRGMAKANTSYYNNAA